MLAMELAALDQLSEGRAILGLGASIKLWIEEQMGIRYDKPVAALRDAVSIIRGLFAGEQLEHRGDAFTARSGIRFNLQPLRSDVPIYLGATAPRTIELADEIADGWLPFGIARRRSARPSNESAAAPGAQAAAFPTFASVLSSSRRWPTTTAPRAKRSSRFWR